MFDYNGAMQPEAKSPTTAFQLVAGNPVLDFVNTLDWRFRPSGAEELLRNYTDLLAFSEQSGLMTAAEVREAASGDPIKQKRNLSSAKKLRECLAAILYAVAEGEPPPAGPVATFSALARRLRAREQLEWSGSRLQWQADLDRRNTMETPIRKLASAALDLLTSEELEKLRACSNPECRWLFLDGSKNKGRRWCDMRLCGNRIKARRYRGRQRAPGW